MRRKIQLQDNIARSITIDDEATIGATVGVDLRLRDGTILSEKDILNSRATAGGTGPASTDFLTEGQNNKYLTAASLAPMLVEGANVTITYDAGAGTIEIAAAGGGAGTWGSIVGTLTDQADLVAALALKANKAGPETHAGTHTFGDLVVDAGGLKIDRTGDAIGATVVFDVDTSRAINMQWKTASLNRFMLAKQSIAETGANAGSPLVLTAYSDAGTPLFTVFTITRADGVVQFHQSPVAPTPAAGSNNTQVATTAYARAAAPNASYRTLLDSSASHTAAAAAATYAMGQGSPAMVSGVGSATPPNILYLDPADYPTVDGLTPKLRLRATINANDVAPGGSFTMGLHPVTRPAVSGTAGLCRYTLGAAVAGSTVAVTPAADSQNNLVGADFDFPAAGFYVLGFVTAAAVAASAHVHLSASLQLHNA